MDYSYRFVCRVYYGISFDSVISEDVEAGFEERNRIFISYSIIFKKFSENG